MASLDSSQGLRKVLQLREWVLIALVLGFVTTLFLVAKPSEIQKTIFEPSNKISKTITVTLTGAVQQPGSYKCTPGITLKKLLQDAPLQKNADRKKINFKKVLFTSQSIFIPEKVRKKGPIYP